LCKVLLELISDQIFLIFYFFVFFFLKATDQLGLWIFKLPYCWGEVGWGNLFLLLLLEKANSNWTIILGQNVNEKGLYDLHRSAYTLSLRIESLTYILSWRADGSSYILTWRADGLADLHFIGSIWFTLWKVDG
jgi:hypothetical protein